MPDAFCSLYPHRFRCWAFLIHPPARAGWLSISSLLSIDLGLSLLACLRKPGETLTAHDIAAWCGCSRAAIQAIEERALRKVRRRLVETANDRELAQELREMLARTGASI